MKSLWSILFVTFLLSACANPKSDDDVKTKSQDRWNQTGNYEYDFTEYKDGSSCRTKHRFNTKAGFCSSLLDREYNQKCALRLRSTEYQKHCGNDFEEVNFKYPGRSGYDPQLGRQCESPASALIYFKANYCEFLKDENLHQQCFQSDRVYEFRFAGCQ